MAWGQYPMAIVCLAAQHLTCRARIRFKPGGMEVAAFTYWWALAEGLTDVRQDRGICMMAAYRC